MRRWHLLQWRGWQLALHKICRSDDDRALHDHSGDNWSLILWGTYFECFSHLWEPKPRGRWGTVGKILFRRAETPHRLMIFNERPVWTIWLRRPPRRQWGFHCPKGWKLWKDYIGQDYRTTGHSPIGKGCD